MPKPSSSKSSSKTQETILLVDGSNLAFRMFFALEMTNLRNSAGDPTWAVYGTLKAIFDVIEAANPTSMAAAFDLPEPSFRHEMFDDYKANRPDEMPDELQAQWGPIKECFKYLHIPLLEEPGFEADDMIGIMTRKAEAAGQKVIVLSGDKDMFQLVTENVSIAVPQRGGGLKFYGPDEVHESMGVWPEQVTDYKGIAGDSSDNLPGIRGLGPKAATKLLGEYGNLEGVYENIEKVGPPKTKEKLVEQEDSARLSKHLATIITEESSLKNTDTDLEKCKLTVPDLDELIAFLKLCEFNSILRRLPVVLKPFNNGEMVKVDVGDLPEEDRERKQKKTKAKKAIQKEGIPEEENDKWEKLETPLTPIEVKPFIIKDESALKMFLKELEKVDHYAVDLETTGLNTLNCEVVGWAFSIPAKSAEKTDFSEAANLEELLKKSEELDKKLKSFYIPVAHENAAQLKAKDVLEKLKPILEDKSKLQIIQNAKYERKILLRHGIEMHSNFYDTMLASYIENPSNKHGLKAQSKRVFHQSMTEIEDIIGTGRKQIKISEAALDKVANYAAADAHVTYKLYLYYNSILSDDSKKVLNDIEQPLVEVLSDIEMAGVSLDIKFLDKLSKEISEKIKNLEANIHRIAGKEFNIASPKQLSEVLFTDLEIEPVGKKNKSGSYSTDISTLESLQADDELSPEIHELIEAIIEYRTLSKLASTYVDNLPNLIAKEDERLHSDFNQVVTATGRLSSSNPNLQNIPIRTEIGRQIRKAFIPRDSEHLIVAADYSQIELRLLAHMANEEKLIEAFKNNEDVHASTAKAIMGKDEITDDDRRIGKTLNFALIYMQGPFATANQLGITMKEAKAFITKYFQEFPKIKPFMDQTIEDAHENSYVTTMFGRKRYFKNINSNNKILQKEEERQAFNAPLQGSAADIMKIAMINLQKELQKFKTKVILQVHDELVLEVPKDELEEIKKLVKSTMESAAELKVPLVVDIGSGENWLEAK